MKRFEDKIVLVTGGGTGIGFAAASSFAQEGATVIISSRSVAGKQAAERIGQEFIQCDVTSHAAHVALMEKIVSKYGSLDVAVNNAGLEQPQASIVDLDIESWQKVLDTNINGVWLGMKAQIPVMKSGGAIINISSIAAIKGLQNVSAYAASKAAVISLTKSAAMECARANIRVNSICPGPVLTEMMERFREQNPVFFKEMILDSIPLGRIGLPEEVASAILWLAKDATFMTGQTLILDGGLTI